MVRLLSAACAAAMLVACPALAQGIAAIDEVAPLPPAGAAAGFVPPDRDAVGYRTPNRDLSTDQTVWHVRVALNVAALGCRGTADGATAAAYNALLAAEQVPLASAVTATRALYHSRHGAAAEARYDDDMTRLYNFFASPPAHDGFCTVAAALLDEARGVAPDRFATFAAHALPLLEAPFTRFFAAYDDYRSALAAWRSRHAPVVIAATAPTPMGPRFGPEAP